MGMGIVATRNRIKLAGGESFEYHLKTCKVNGSVRGCSGWVVNPKTGRTVYVNTEGSDYGPLQGKVMYRQAADVKDYRGIGSNQWASPEAFAPAVVHMLTV